MRRIAGAGSLIVVLVILGLVLAACSDSTPGDSAGEDAQQETPEPVPADENADQELPDTPDTPDTPDSDSPTEPGCATGAAELPAVAPPFEELPAVLEAFLNAGGDPEAILPRLQAWAPAGENAVRTDVDLTGDGRAEVVVVASESIPSTPAGPANALIVFACADSRYESLLVVQPRGTIALEALADITGSGQASLVYSTSICGAHTCTLDADVLTYDAGTRALVSLLASPIREEPSAVLRISEATPAEIAIEVGMIGSAGAGPQRASRTTFGWDGARYVLRETTITTPMSQWYPIHYLADGDRAAREGDFEAALAAYNEVILAQDPPRWTDDPQEVDQLRVYAIYRSMVVEARRGGVPGAPATIFAEYSGEGLPADAPPGFDFMVGKTFWDVYRDTGDVEQACAAVVAYASERPQSYAILNQFGYANPIYGAEDLC